LPKALCLCYRRESMQSQAFPVVGTSAASAGRQPLQRVREAISALGCTSVWARGSGNHVLLGLPGDDAFARLTPLGGSAYGLTFRSADERSGALRWEPMFLVDELPELVEHALIAVDAVGI
jgi:hypothetical protein